MADKTQPFTGSVNKA